MGTWYLKPIRGSAPVVRLGRQKVSIGRHPDNAVPLTDDLASRFHCEIEPGSEGFLLKDLNSKNGTKVNEVRVKEASLKAGDVVRVGHHEFLLEVDEDDADRSALSDSAVEPSPLGNSHDRDLPWASALTDLINNLPPKQSRLEEPAIIDSMGKPSQALSGTSDGPGAVRLLLLAAAKARATDLHIEPKQSQTFNVRLRVDGQMVAIAELPERVGELVFGLVKSACNMRVAGRDAVLEGHFSAIFGERRVEYRVSLTPSVHGQKLVLRVLDTLAAPSSLSEMGMAQYMADRVRRTCDQDHGLLLTCGPTGSGKTTTLYNALREIDREARNVVTIEDPVEYQLDNITQIPIDEHKGNTFGGLLRSVLRQDPDVILVGEIRDEETARTAMQAAMTGHLVFSTVHAKDTIAAVFRLLDLKVEPYLVANSLDLVLAQRLVRLLCDHCKRAVPVPPGVATRLGRFLQGKNEMYVATGCARCLRTGFRGRRAIFELLEFNDDLRDVVLKSPTIADMKRIIEQGLFTTLAQFGWRLVSEGITTLDEVDRVAGQG
ncbi:MAG: Flp pilus assembly complex ATPase component TadA [Phycisphaeraceae bacterium]|nr:MAG: Flp pilus assembly complex ATPase component TadA [Phycisphaeraceae bacterium]